MVAKPARQVANEGRPAIVNPSTNARHHTATYINLDLPTLFPYFPFYDHLPLHPFI